MIKPKQVRFKEDLWQIFKRCCREKGIYVESCLENLIKDFLKKEGFLKKWYEQISK